MSDAHSKASNTAFVMLPQAGNLDVDGNEIDGKKLHNLNALYGKAFSSEATYRLVLCLILITIIGCWNGA